MASTKEATQTPQTAVEDANAVVDQEARVTPRRFFTIPGRDPFDEIDWELRDALIPGRDGPAFEQREVEFPKFWSQTATNIVAQKYFRGRLSSPERERSVKQMIGRVVDTIGAWGRRGALLRGRDGGGDVRGRAEGDPRQPDRLVQLAGLVQRRLRGAPAVLGLLHPLDRRHDGLDPGLDPARGDHLPRRLGLGRQSLPAALVAGAALEGRLRERPGQLHARRRRVGGHDQIGRQDPARSEDGRARRRPPGRRGVHLVQGQGGAQGARPRAGGLRHVARLARLGLDPVPEREQLGPRQRRLHGGCGREQGVEPDRAHRRHRRPDDRRQSAAEGRSRPQPGSAPTRASSTTRRSTPGTRCRTRAGSTRPTPVRSTCRSTTAPAISPRST